MCGSLGDESGDVISEWYRAYECNWLGCNGEWLVREDIANDPQDAHCPKCGTSAVAGMTINSPGRKLILVVRVE